LPALYACADVFAMCCRDRWFGLEAEGFGIVFLEAAACGVPAVAGRSGGSHEAVADGATGYVVAPRDVAAVRDAIAALVDDEALRARMGEAARRRGGAEVARAPGGGAGGGRAVEEFAYARLGAQREPVARGELSVVGLLDR